MARTVHPQLSFTDLEFQRQGVALDQTLQAVSDFLDLHGALVDLVYQDLVRGLKKPHTGREGIDPERVLRSFLLQRIKNWDLRELRERVADSYTLRQFTAFRSDPVPSHQAFHTAFCRLTPATMRAANEAVVQAAVQLGVEDGNQLRVDTTVVQTHIHHPTDSTLLWDGVRVLTRLVERLGQLVPEGNAPFPNRCRRARRRMLEISRMDRQQRQRQQRRKYGDLLKITQEVVARAHPIAAQGRQRVPADPCAAARCMGLVKEIEHYCRLAEKVIQQTRRRVLEGETVPAEEKILSLFEPHTDLIKRGKVDPAVEFGHKIFLAESARGLITDYRVLEGNLPDEQQVQPSLQQHQQLFGHAPQLYAADRGFYSAANLQHCEAAQIQIISLPYRGGQKTPERQAWEKSPAFKKGQRFRAGIEGRISVLFRARGMKRCLLEGRERFEVFVGAAVLANNLIVIAERLRQKRSRRPGR
jgi:transposase, IS5 family